MPAYQYNLTHGVSLPQDSGYLILSSLSQKFPFVHGAPLIQIAPVRGARTRNPAFLRTDRSSVLHIRGITEVQAQGMENQWVNLLGTPLQLQSLRKIEMEPSETLVSRLVILKDIVDPEHFLEVLKTAYPGAAVALGRRRTLAIKGLKHIGYATVLSKLTKEQALSLLENGLGKHTSMGCGTFYKGSPKF